jgi:hypothetical protein
MRVTHFLPLLLLVHSGVSSAVLGGLPEKFNEDALTVVSKNAPNYSVLETTLATGTQVRQYVSARGVVFAITWSGPFLPELQGLLGKHFDTLLAESARTTRAGRSRIAINHGEVVINLGGHMRSFEGEAWIPAEMPANFTVNAGF